MTSLTRRMAALAAAGMFSLPAAAGQEDQFTPEFAAVRSSYDEKHTPKLTAPDSVKRGQWFEVSVSVGAGGEHPSLSEHHVRYIALYMAARRSPALTCIRCIRRRESPSPLRSTRAACCARSPSRLTRRPGRPPGKSRSRPREGRKPSSPRRRGPSLKN